MTFRLGDKIEEYLEQNKPCDIRKIPSAYEHAFGETTWVTFTKNAVWKKGFDDSMTIRNKTISTPWHKKYPVKEGLSSPKPVIVDIGGNQGVDLQRFADDYPEIDCELVLQDLPETIQGIPAGTLGPKVKPVEYDFFTEQVVKGKFPLHILTVPISLTDVYKARISIT